jgi:hypothetical protein
LSLIDTFLNCIDGGALIFKEGEELPLRESGKFCGYLKTHSALETEADITRRKIENILYTQSIIPSFAG